MTGRPTIRVAVHGAAGRVGQEVVRAVSSADDMALSAAIDRLPRGGAFPLPTDVPYFTDVREAFRQVPSDVVVDFSVPRATLAMVPLAIAARTRLVIGTTGFADDQLRQIEALCGEHQLGGVLAPNFTIGAVLLTRLAAIAAPYFDYVDLLEEHHEMKNDAPSGTALAIAAAIREAHPERFTSVAPEREPLPGTRGGDYEGVRIHSTRMPGRMAHHQVTFGGPGQTLMLRHDTNNRECYMPGVLLAVRRVVEFDRLVIGLDKLLRI